MSDIETEKFIIFWKMSVHSKFGAGNMFQNSLDDKTLRHFSNTGKKKTKQTKEKKNQNLLVTWLSLWEGKMGRVVWEI